MKGRMRRERRYMDGKRDICVYVCMYVALGRYIWPSINQPVHLCKVRNFPLSHFSSASFSHKWFSKSLTARHIHSVLTGVIFCQHTSTVAPLFTVNLVFQSKDSNILEVCTHSPFFLALHFPPCDVSIEAGATYSPLALSSRPFLWPKFPPCAH